MAEHMLNLREQVKQNQTDLQDFLRDLNTWEDKIRHKDQALNTTNPSDEKVLPPVRNSAISKGTVSKSLNQKKELKSDPKPERISSYDYRSWDKYNVDEALEHINDEDDHVEGDIVKEQQQESETKEQLLQKALFEKDQGNELFKSGKYQDAVNCYTRGIAADPNNAILYANRAMSYIKLKRYTDAEKDCTSSIAVDKTYAKAYARRGTARIALQKLDDSRSDFKEVLQLEPDNKFARNELKKIALALNPKRQNDSGEEKTLKKRTKAPLRRIKIAEIGSDSDNDDNMQISQATTSESTTVADNDQTKSAARVTERPQESEILSKVTAVPLRAKVFQPPNSPFQFEKDWKEICHSSQHVYQYIRVIEPESYPKLFQESLDSEKFIKFMNVFLIYYLSNDQLVFKELTWLCKVKRFDIILLFLSGEEKKTINEVFVQMKKLIDNTVNKDYQPADLYQLASKYGVKL